MGAPSAGVGSRDRYCIIMRLPFVLLLEERSPPSPNSLVSNLCQVNSPISNLYQANSRIESLSSQLTRTESQSRQLTRIEYLSSKLTRIESGSNPQLFRWGKPQLDGVYDRASRLYMGFTVRTSPYDRVHAKGIQTPNVGNVITLRRNIYPGLGR